MLGSVFLSYVGVWLVFCSVGGARAPNPRIVCRPAPNYSRKLQHFSGMLSVK